MGLDVAAVTEALSSLPEEEREVVVARIWGGLSFEQIADAVESSAATCYRRYSAGLDDLRKKLGVDTPAKTR